MREVSGAILDCPFLHGVRNDVGHFDVKRFAVVDGAHQAFIRDGWQAFGHHVLVENFRPVDRSYVRHGADPRFRANASSVFVW